jgi:hypothetical protein
VGAPLLESGRSSLGLFGHFAFLDPLSKINFITVVMIILLVLVVAALLDFVTWRRPDRLAIGFRLVQPLRFVWFSPCVSSGSEGHDCP